MLDTNMMDSHPKHADPRHNICGQQNNPPGASCSATGGPKDLDDCFKYMWDTWLHQKTRRGRSRQRHPTLPRNSGRLGWSKQSDRKPTMMIYYILL